MGDIRIKVVVFAVCAMIIGAMPAGAAEPGCQALYAFALDLYDSGDAARAEGELKRFVYFCPSDPMASQAENLLADLEAASEAEALAVQNAETGGPTAALVRFYQDHLRTYRSPDSACPSYPSCSEYALEAIDKHGGLLGAFIFVDRYWREVTTAGTPPYVYRHDRRLHYDPLAVNDYWLTPAEAAP